MSLTQGIVAGTISAERVDNKIQITILPKQQVENRGTGLTNEAESSTKAEDSMDEAILDNYGATNVDAKGRSAHARHLSNINKGNEKLGMKIPGHELSTHNSTQGLAAGKLKTQSVNSTQYTTIFYAQASDVGKSVEDTHVAAERKRITTIVQILSSFWVCALIMLLVSALVATKYSGDFVPTHDTTQSNQDSSPSEIQIGKPSAPPSPVNSFRIIEYPSPNVVRQNALFTTLHNKFKERLSNKYFMKRVVALVGTSGVGKTEAARQFAQEYREYYENVAWVDAETESSTTASFLKIANILRVPSASKINGKQLARLVYRHINDHVLNTTLLIFDNVKQLQSTGNRFGIYDYLPTEVMENPPLILFISQKKDWREYNFEILEVTHLSKEESLESLRALLHISPSQLHQDSELQVLLENLVERLNGCPMELRSVADTISGFSGQRSLSLLRDKLRDYIRWMDDTKLATELAHYSIANRMEEQLSLSQQLLLYLFPSLSALCLFLYCCMNYFRGEPKSRKVLNILVIGETGVGKSTWINGILNYLKHKSLEEAIEKPLLWAIPMSFSITNRDTSKQETAAVGEDPNEKLARKNDTESVTQYPRAYTYSRGDTLVRIIDTPGIADARGLAQDDKNFECMLAYLRDSVKELHGICILLPAEMARPAVVFNFYVKELLTHLHRDACKNVVFCFTKARATFYKLDLSLRPLEKLLNDVKVSSGIEIALTDSTKYTMDNEAIRFLVAAKHNNVQFTDQDKQEYAASWKRSADETKRLFKHFEQIKPHKTGKTLSLNHARKMIIELDHPWSTINEEIRKANVKDLENAEIPADVSNSHATCPANEKLKQLEQARHKMKQIKVYFAVFLKKYGIMAVNDAREEYLQYWINQQRRNGASEDAIFRLELSKQEYIKQIRTIQKEMKEVEQHSEAMSAPEDQLSRKMIDRYFDDLINLTDSRGDRIKNMVQFQNEATEHIKFPAEVSLDAVCNQSRVS